MREHEFMNFCSSFLHGQTCRHWESKKHKNMNFGNWNWELLMELNRKPQEM